MPSMDVVHQLCLRFGVTLAQIFEGEELQADLQKHLKFLQNLLYEQDFEGVIHQGGQLLHRKIISEGPASARAEVLFLIGKAMYELQAYNDSLGYLKNSYDLSKTHELNSLWTYANAYAGCLITTRRYKAAFDLLESAYHVGKILRLEDKVFIRVIYNLALVTRKLGFSEESFQYVLVGSEMCKRTGVYECAGNLESLRGLICWDAGKLPDAYTAFQQALHFYQFIDDQKSIAGCLENIKELLPHGSIGHEHIKPSNFEYHQRQRN